VQKSYSHIRVTDCTIENYQQLCIHFLVEPWKIKYDHGKFRTVWNLCITMDQDVHYAKANNTMCTCCHVTSSALLHRHKHSMLNKHPIVHQLLMILKVGFYIVLYINIKNAKGGTLENTLC